MHKSGTKVGIYKSKNRILIVFLEKIYYFCAMSEINVVIITKSEELPCMQCHDFFHSDVLFRVVESTPGQKPYMVIAYDGADIVGHMLVMLRRRGSLFPPYLFTQGRVYGEGEYASNCDREAIFNMMLKHIVRKLRRDLCLYIEFSDLSSKMFGYGKFRVNGFFPVHWMEVHNSLHSMSPTRRLTSKTAKYIANAKRLGLKTVEAKTVGDVNKFLKILRGHISFRIRRFIPDSKLFIELIKQDCCSLYTTTYKGDVTSGCVCVYSNGNCYLWYLAAKHKYYMRRANAITIWTAMKHAYAKGCWHMCFMDVGLPLKKDKFRDFILGFGGKPVGTYRWFRCSFNWINRLLSWIYRD